MGKDGKVTPPRPTQRRFRLVEGQPNSQEFLNKELKRFYQVQGRTPWAKHRIRLKDGVEPICQKYYPCNPAMQAIINDEVDMMLAEGVIEHSASPWSSPIVSWSGRTMGSIVSVSISGR